MTIVAVRRIELVVEIRPLLTSEEVAESMAQEAWGEPPQKTGDQHE